MVSITISIVSGIPSLVDKPFTVHEGRRTSIEPKSTISTVPARNRYTDSFAVKGTTVASFDFLSKKENSPRRNLFRNSSSSFNSLPMPDATSAPINTPISVAGTATIRISSNVYPKGVSIPRRATVAADIGLAVMACCEAITAIDSGRSGRTRLSAATSAITGSSEYETCPVPATKVNK